MADYGVPQTRRRFVLVAGRGFGIPFPEPTHARLPDATGGRDRWVTVREAIGGNAAPVTLAYLILGHDERAKRHLMLRLLPGDQFWRKPFLKEPLALLLRATHVKFSSPKADKNDSCLPVSVFGITLRVVGQPLELGHEAIPGSNSVAKQYTNDQQKD